jgi:hypothetical protein
MDALPQDNHLQMRSYYFPPFKNCTQPFSRICFYYEACVPVCHEKSSCCLFPAFSAADCACFNKDSSLADYLGIAVKSKLASGMEFLASHEGPYLIHCTEGKDRAGFVSALLECLIGAGAESYLLSTGISSETIQTIKDNLKG